MKTLKFRILALILAITMIFGGCVPFMPQITNDDPYLGHELISYEDMEYTRPDMTEIEQVFERAMETALRADAFEAVEASVWECIEVYYSFYTQHNLAYIKYCCDVTDSYWQEENDYCTENAVTLENLLNEWYCALADSEYREQLETDELFGENFFDDYEDDTYTDEAYTSLLEAEAELLEQYYALVEESSQSGHTGSAYYAVYAKRYTELYIELVKVRQSIAQYLGYENYLEYAYINDYYRDYTPQEVDVYLNEIGTTFKDDYTRLCTLNIWGFVSDPCTEADTIGYLRKATEAMGEVYQAGFNALTTAKLYDISYSSSKYDVSYEVFLPDYGQPFIFMCPYSYQGDKLTFAHEFGHFMNDYVCAGSNVGIDVAEIHSQAFEYLSLCYVTDEPYLAKYKMASSLCTYVETGAYSMFEQKIYQLSEEELTVENVYAIYKEVGNYFGFDARGFDTREFVDIPHIFIYPAYMISYVVSNDISMQFYQLELEEKGKGLAMYEDCLYSQDTYIIEFAEKYGLESPFKEGRLSELDKIFQEALK